jgi:hypothetical protein
MTSFLFLFLPASPKTEAGLGIAFSVRTSVPARQDVTCTDYGYWKGIVEDTRKFVKQCEICQRQNKKVKTAVPELNSVSIGQRVWGKIGIDLIRPFLTEKKEPLSTNGYR